MYDNKNIKQGLLFGMKETGILKVAESADESTWFKLKSGKMSPLFWNMQRLCDYPKLFEMAVVLMSDKAAVHIDKDSKFDKVAGVPDGATGFAYVIANRLGKPAMTIRKTEKDRGQGGKFIGTLDQNTRVLIIEDVSTTGLSILKDAALPMYRAVGSQVVFDALTLMNRQEGATQNLAAGVLAGVLVDENKNWPNPVKLHSVMTQSEAIEQVDIAPEMKQVIMNYLNKNIVR